MTAAIAHIPRQRTVPTINVRQHRDTRPELWALAAARALGVLMRLIAWVALSVITFAAVITVGSSLAETVGNVAASVPFAVLLVLIAGRR